VHGILPAAPPPDRPPGPPSLSNPDRSLKQPDHAQSSFADYLAARERDANLVARGHDRNRDATSPGHHRLPAGGKDGGSLSTLPRKNGTKDPSSGSISAERDESAARRNAAKVTQHLEAVEAEHRSVEDAGKLKTGSESGFSRTNEDYLHDEVAHVGAAAVHVPSVAEGEAPGRQSRPWHRWDRRGRGDGEGHPRWIGCRRGAERVLRGYEIAVRDAGRS
jgi:hypothetical protein